MERKATGLFRQRGASHNQTIPGRKCCERMHIQLWSQIEGTHPFKEPSQSAWKKTANILNNLAVLYLSQGRYGEAEPLYTRVLTIREQQFGPTHPHTATSLYNLAMLQRDKGNIVEAERLYQRTLVIREQHLGPEHPSFADCLDSPLLFMLVTWTRLQQN